MIALTTLQNSRSGERSRKRTIKRLLDLIFAIPLLVVCCPLFLLLYLAVRFTSRGPALYYSQRVGRDNSIFLMPKFRSMRTGTPQVATHLLSTPKSYMTPIGSFLRRSSLDEVPQLWSILRGDLSFVGPRPALFNQHDLIALRTQYNVHSLVPGLTGWAQVNGRDSLGIPAKVEFDYQYLLRQSSRFDLKILMLTVFRILRSDGVSH